MRMRRKLTQSAEAAAWHHDAHRPSSHRRGTRPRKRGRPTWARACTSTPTRAAPSSWARSPAPCSSPPPLPPVSSSWCQRRVDARQLCSPAAAAPAAPQATSQAWLRPTSPWQRLPPCRRSPSHPQLTPAEGHSDRSPPRRSSLSPPLPPWSQPHHRQSRCAGGGPGTRRRMPCPRTHTRAPWRRSSQPGAAPRSRRVPAGAPVVEFPIIQAPVVSEGFRCEVLVN